MKNEEKTIINKIHNQHSKLKINNVSNTPLMR